MKEDLSCLYQGWYRTKRTFSIRRRCSLQESAFLSELKDLWHAHMFGYSAIKKLEVCTFLKIMQISQLNPQAKESTFPNAAPGSTMSLPCTTQD